jgi:alkylation response protein AidB-like acyl-CoA dehydrogenase
VASNTETLIGRAREIGQAVRTRADAAEAARTIPAETMRELDEAELFRIFQPARYGGFELGYETFVPAVIEIGKQCGSTGWVYSVFATHAWQASLFPPAAHDDLWRENPRALLCSAFAPTGTATEAKGGYEFAGRWSFVSGCDHAGWSIVCARIVRACGDGAAPELGFFLVPRADWRIEDDWTVVGLNGTGSKSIVVEGCFVPAHRRLLISEARTAAPPGTTANTGPLYRVNFFIGTGYGLALPVTAIARGALDDYVAEVSGRASHGGLGGPPKKMAEYAHVQMRVAESGAAIDAALALAQTNGTCVLEAAAAGRPSDELRQRTLRDLAYGARIATQSVDRLFESEGGHGIYASSRIQRAWRDAHAASMHVGTNWDRAGSAYGRYILGLDP